MNESNLFPIESLQHSPLLTASILDILLKSDSIRDMKIELSDNELYHLMSPHNISNSTAIRLLSRNKISVTNIHLRDDRGRNVGHIYKIDLSKLNTPRKVYKISALSYPLISTSVT